MCPWFVAIKKNSFMPHSPTMVNQILWHLKTCKTISSGARYVTLQSKIRWRKSNTCRFGSGKWFRSQHNGLHCPWLVEGTAALCTWKKSVINMIQLQLSVSDWRIIMIGPGGLLLVVPHLFAVLVSVLWVGLQKST
jgi:hypothetical protein